MQFSWKTALWKAAKTALVAGLGVLAAAGGFDVLIELAMKSSPVWAAPLLLGLLTLIRNFYKQWAKSLPTDQQ